MSNNYAKAYKEVLEIIKYFPEKEYSKIPKEKIEFLKENIDKNYEFSIDPNIDLTKQNISREAYAIFIVLFHDYYATEKQKEKIKKILEQNEKKSEQEKRIRYNPDNLFKNKNLKASNNIYNSSQNLYLAEYRENLFIKFKKFVLNLFHIKYN